MGRPARALRAARGRREAAGSPARRQARGPAREPPGAGKTRLLLPLPLPFLPIPHSYSFLLFQSLPLFTISFVSLFLFLGGPVCLSRGAAGAAGAPHPASRTHLLHPNSSGPRCTPQALPPWRRPSSGAPGPLHPLFFPTPSPGPQLPPRSPPARAAGPTRPPHLLHLGLAFAGPFQAPSAQNPPSSSIVPLWGTQICPVLGSASKTPNLSSLS